MIEIENLTFQYTDGQKPALNNIDLTIGDGDFVGIIGNSGAGKTTLIYALSGVVPHHFTGDFYGAVRVDGMDTVEVKPEVLARTVGSVFQDVDAQMVTTVVEDELMFGLENFGVPHEEIQERIQTTLRQVGIENLRTRNIRSLSGGQKQKVAIAAILALRPRILLLDEPTGELDPQSSQQVFQVLKELNEAFGITVVVVEQKIMQLCAFAKKLLVIDGGEAVLYGPVREVLGQSNLMQKLGIHVPRVVSLQEKLGELGLYHGPLPMNIPEAENMVREVLS